jgi:hypothetical protein
MSNYVYVHDVTLGIIDELSGYDKVFLDDGLYSHYYYRDHLSSLNVPIYFSIPTSFIYNGCIRRHFPKFKEPSVYMYEYHCKNIKSNFMTWDEVRSLKKYDNFYIVPHSHYHRTILTNGRCENINDKWKRCLYKNKGFDCFDIISGFRSALVENGFEIISGKLHKRSMKDLYDFIVRDTQLMMDMFLYELDDVPHDYVFPFNHQSDFLIDILGNEFGFDNFYGKDRNEL